eukprot:g4196.t1
MRPIPLDDEMMRLKRLAQVREEKLRNQASGDPAGLHNEGEEDAGVAVDEHADTWGFSWMPAIEDFVEQAHRDEGGSDVTDDEGEETGPQVRAPGRRSRSRSGSRDPGHKSSSGRGSDLVPGSCPGGGGRKRRRPEASAWPSSSSSSSSSSPRRRTPRPPTYNETLLADKSFHNPHASETMADAFGILRPASFVLDVEDDDRPWGSAGAEAVGAANATIANGDGVISAGSSGGGGGGDGGEDDRNWFYDTVRDRQNRLWANTRVRKGVELARKGQHQAAIDAYTQALGMCPDHDDGLVARGAAFATTGRLRQAVQDLSQALSLNPDNDNASRYLKETRRRMERQDSRLSPGPGVAAVISNSNTSRLEHRAVPGAVADNLGRGGPTAGNADRDEASRAALGALLHDGAEADALRKMRALLEEDQRKRKHREGRGGGAGGGGSSSSRKKKNRKEDKKSSSSKSKRRSSSRRDKKRDRRGSGGVEADYDSSSSSSSGGGGGSDVGDNSSADARSSSSKKKNKREKEKKTKKKKKKQHHKHRNRPSVGSRNDADGRGGLSGTISASLSTGGEEDSGDEAHPILQRKKHSLWG